MENTRKLIEDYIKAHENAWAPSTLKSERARLNAVADRVTSVAPLALYDELAAAGRSPYSIKTLFIRLADLYTWANLDNKWRRFVDENARLFKYAYKREQVNIDYTSAKARIAAIKDKEVRALAFDMLRSGMRASEALNRTGAFVEGKGGKVRRVFTQGGLPGQALTYSRLYKELRSVGLKPHTLRKLAATELARAGLQAQDLMEVFGWNNIATAQWYLQPLAGELLEQKIAEVFNG